MVTKTNKKTSIIRKQNVKNVYIGCLACKVFYTLALELKKVEGIK